MPVARLLLVRHGQASFGADDYDALSPLGHEQARTLGKSLSDRGVRPALLVRGALRRHAETAAGILDGLAMSVDVAIDPGWDEFDFQHVVEIHRPLFRDRAALAAELAREARPDRAFQEIFEAATTRWASGDHDLEYGESFPAFRNRVAAALASAETLLRAHREVLVVSSGGPIAMAATLLTTGSVAGWAAFNRVSVNTGVTKVIAGSRGLSLSTFNEHPHLEADRRLLTYR
ncbi:phosphoglycerate mutase [Actinoplanes campanulatus]|nr:phosphoglycerate mutase [Actinoplanes campanulatus]GID36430.1 phosphoglycerate mutase [Actinoplanes campanulatus]